jgi:hypothetical protein
MILVEGVVGFAEGGFDFGHGRAGLSWAAVEETVASGPQTR